MNRLILKYKYPITFAILAVLVWGLGTCVFLYFWPPITYSAYKRAVVQHGLGGDPIPVNTLYAVPTLSSPLASNASLLATGTNDVLYVGGLLDLSNPFLPGKEMMMMPPVLTPDQLQGREAACREIVRDVEHGMTVTQARMRQSSCRSCSSAALPISPLPSTASSSRRERKVESGRRFPTMDCHPG